jgi:hypothetical protein
VNWSDQISVSRYAVQSRINSLSYSSVITSHEILFDRRNSICCLESLVLTAAKIGLKCLSLRFSWIRRKGLRLTQSLHKQEFELIIKLNEEVCHIITSWVKFTFKNLLQFSMKSGLLHKKSIQVSMVEYPTNRNFMFQIGKFL